jgi:hypothetical protein
VVGVVTVSFELLASSYARRQQVAPISTIGAAARLSSSIFWLQPSQVASLVVSAAVMESLIAGYLYHRPIKTQTDVRNSCLAISQVQYVD